MLTGDGKTTAEAVGTELGIDEVVAEVFPEDKAAVVQRLRSRRAAWWPWPATVSTTPPPLLPPTSASPWAQVPM